MKRPSKRYAAVAGVLIFAGCAGSSAAVPSGPAASSAGFVARRGVSWILPEAKRARELLYVADPTPSPSYTGVIDIFELSGLKYKLIGQIQDDDAPDGMTTDSAGNLYVTDMGVSTEGRAPGEIKIYPKGSTSYSRLIQPANWVPFDIAVGRDGTMYVANIAPIESFAPGSVSIYPPNADQPSRVLRLKNFQVYGIARHAHTSDIYISYLPTGNGDGTIAQFRHARGKAIPLGVSYPDPWGLLEDGNDHLLAASGSGSVNVYDEANGELVSQLSVPNAALWLAFDQQRNHLFVTNFEQVEILSYPAGSLIGTVNPGTWNTSNYPTGLAIWPPP
jgi:hypothetical protein